MSAKQLKSLIFITITVFIVTVSYFFISNDVAVAQVDLGLSQAEQIGLSGADPRVIVARVIQAALGLLGMVTLGLLVYAGYLWMTSQGNEDQVGKSKTLMKNGLIGLIIILSAFGIVTFVLSRLAPGQVSVPGLSGRRGSGGIMGGGGFPLGVIDMHYPEQGQTNVPRNTNIMVAFVEPMLVESIINSNGTPDDPGDDVINPANIQILKLDDDPAEGPFVQARAQVSDDGRTFVFDPIDLLGSSDQNVQYLVILGEGISTAIGKATFGSFGAYSWDFEVGTIIDLEPPYVESFIPQPDTTHPRNVVIQITFNESMNPLTVIGDVLKGFDNITVRTSNGDLVEGRYLTSNQFKTVEFITNDLCGTNSCGDDVFCLPGNTTLKTYIRSASVGPQPPSALFPVDGITDAASNSLDGNIDGIAQGPTEDDFTWNFNTTDQIDLTAPVITAVSPEPYTTQVLLNSPLTATFSKPLLFSSINRMSVQVPELENFSISAKTENNSSWISILHPDFSEESTYTPAITSDVKDLYQNCFRPCSGP